MTEKAKTWRRFEVLLPLTFNDGRSVPEAWHADALKEIIEHFEAASFETQKVEGHSREEGVPYRDDLVKIVVDAPDSEASRQWMREYKTRWREKLQQVDLWVVSYVIEMA